MTIPSFPEFVPLGLEHKQEVDAAFRQTEPAISEFTFTNLFIWRRYYKVSLSRSGGFLLILSRREGKPPFFFPPWGDGDARPVIRQCVEYIGRQDGSACIERAPAEYVERHVRPSPDLAMFSDPDNEDYVYNSQDLIELKGRKYDGKRNAISKFQRSSKYEYRPIDENLIKLCMELQDFWCAERKCGLYPGLVEERRAINEAFSNCETLAIRGGAIVMDGKVEAFSLGEKLNSNTFVVHIEKANPNIPGLYAVINQQFAAHEASGFAYVNREQDLGDEGLRMAKESYQPAFKVRKFKVCGKG